MCQKTSAELRLSCNSILRKHPEPPSGSANATELGPPAGIGELQALEFRARFRSLCGAGAHGAESVTGPNQRRVEGSNGIYLSATMQTAAFRRVLKGLVLL